MIVVGLTGGLASGKSTVARLFRDCGAILIDADALARRVVEPGKPAWREIVRTYGRQVLCPDRTLDRAALAKIVFRDRVQLRRLNAIVHPRVAREQAKLTREIAKKQPRAVVIYDVPLLFEAGVHKGMDRTIVVAADRRTQIARLQTRNGLTRAEALRRIRSQMPLAKKINLADYVLDGTLPPSELRREVKHVYGHLCEPARKASLRIPSGGPGGLGRAARRRISPA
jgi:dephospho-CoA kinase